MQNTPVCQLCRSTAPVAGKTMCRSCYARTIQDEYRAKKQLAAQQHAQQGLQQQPQLQNDNDKKSDNSAPMLCRYCQKNSTNNGHKYCDSCTKNYHEMRQRKLARQQQGGDNAPIAGPAAAVAAVAAVAAAVTELAPNKCKECRMAAADRDGMCQHCFVKWRRSQHREEREKLKNETTTGFAGYSSEQLQAMEEKQRAGLPLSVKEKLVLKDWQQQREHLPQNSTTTAVAAAASSPCRVCPTLRSQFAADTDALKKAHAAEIAEKDQEIEALTARLRAAEMRGGGGGPPVFDPDRPYKLNFAAAGVPPQLEPGQVASVAPFVPLSSSAPSATAATTPLQNFIVDHLWKKRGSMFPTPEQPVVGFSLVGIDVVNPEGTPGFEDRLRRLQRLRQSSSSGSLFNPVSSAFDAEQLQVLIALQRLFLPRPSNASPQSPNIAFLFHGTRVEQLDSVLGGIVAVRSSDAGFFGSPCSYLTPSIEYAAKYAAGRFDLPGDDDAAGPRKARASDGAFPVVMCAAAIGVAFPVTTKDIDNDNKKGPGHTRFFGAPLERGFDSHVVPVREPSCMVCPSRETQYLEVCIEQESAVLPVAVLWVK